MTIGEVMKTCVVECTEDTGLDEAYELLRKCDHRIVVVVDGPNHRRPIGVVTERSICEQVIGRGRNPRSLPAGSVMDTRIMRVRENEPVASIAIANPDEIAAVVVVNDRREVCGVLTKEHLAVLGQGVATTNSTGRIFVTKAPRVSPAIREIPAFGWIQ